MLWLSIGIGIGCAFGHQGFAMFPTWKPQAVFITKSFSLMILNFNLLSFTFSHSYHCMYVLHVAPFRRADMINFVSKGITFHSQHEDLWEFIQYCEPFKSQLIGVICPKWAKKYIVMLLL